MKTRDCCASVLLVVLLCTAAFARGGGSGALSKVKVWEPSDVAVCVTGDLNESEKSVLGSWIFHALVNSGRFTAAEHAAAFTAEAENVQAAQSNDAVDDGHIGRIAKQFGIRYVCIVGVASFSSHYSVSARVLDTKTAKIITSGRVYSELNTTQALEALSVDVATEMGVGWYRPLLPPTAAPPQQPVATAPSTPPPPVESVPPPPAVVAPQPEPVAIAPPAPLPPVEEPVPPPPPPAVTPQPVASAPATPPETIAPPPAAVDTTPPLPLEAIGASIIIHSKPPEAEVYIGERLIGKTNQPDKLLVPIGTHDLKFVKDDVEITETMTFQPGENPTKLVLLDDGKPKKKSKPKAKAH